MKRKRFTEEQMIGILNEHASGLSVKNLVRKHGITEQTFYRWKSKWTPVLTLERKGILCSKGHEGYRRSHSVKIIPNQLFR